jgi:NitT/TauT family transport system permease protein
VASVHLPSRAVRHRDRAGAETLGGRVRPRRLRPVSWLAPLVAFALLTLAWQLYAEHHPAVLPTVGQVLSRLADQPGLYGHALLVTLRESLVGAAVGMLAGFLVAVAMCELRLVEQALMPVAVVLNVTPIVAIAPGLTVAFGFGFLPKYIVTAVVVFFPFLVASLAGLRSADPGALEVLATLHASNWEVLRRLRVPSSLPLLFTGARVCLPLSVVGAVVAEFTASSTSIGLGSLITIAAGQADLPQIYASVLVLAVLGIALTLIVVLLQRRLLSWHVSAQPSAT